MTKLSPEILNAAAAKFIGGIPRQDGVWTGISGHARKGLVCEDGTFWNPHDCDADAFVLLALAKVDVSFGLNNKIQAFKYDWKKEEEIGNTSNRSLSHFDTPRTLRHVILEAVYKCSQNSS